MHGQAFATQAIHRVLRDFQPLEMLVPIGLQVFQDSTVPAGVEGRMLRRRQALDQRVLYRSVAQIPRFDQPRIPIPLPSAWRIEVCDQMIGERGVVSNEGANAPWQDVHDMRKMGGMFPRLPGRGVEAVRATNLTRTDTRSQAEDTVMLRPMNAFAMISWRRPPAPHLAKVWVHRRHRRTAPPSRRQPCEAFP